MHLTVDASYSHAKRTDFLLENYSGTGYITGGARDTLQDHPDRQRHVRYRPTLDYGNAANFGITDPRGWGYNGTTAVVQAGFLNKPSFKDDLAALRASLDGEFAQGGLLKGWEVGANYSYRKKTSAFLVLPVPQGRRHQLHPGQRHHHLCPDPAGRDHRHGSARLPRRAAHARARSDVPLQQRLQRGVRQPPGLAGARQLGDRKGLDRLCHDQAGW
jgi:hypothetical protein